MRCSGRIRTLDVPPFEVPALSVGAISLCRDLDFLHVVGPFVTEPEPAHPVYWRLHGISGPRHSYADAEMLRLRDLLRRVRSDAPAYVMFNNLSRVGDAKRFARLSPQEADDA